MIDDTMAAVRAYIRSGRSRQALADASGVHRNTLVGAEREDWEPSVRIVKRLAEGLRALPPTTHPNPCNIPV